MLLAGDIGGTKTNLAIFALENGPKAPLVEATFPSGAYPSLEALVKEFLTSVDYPVSQACFGVAGPVLHRRASVTNLPWEMSEPQLQEALNIGSVQLLNDLAAIASALPVLDAADLHVLNAGEQVQGGAMAVIAPGTGLGEAFLTWDGSKYIVHPSEGGHADFAPTTATQVELLSYLLERFQHVSVERVCSGIGIPNIYGFLRDSGRAAEPEWLAKKLAQTDDPTPVIARAGLSGECELCVATLKTFVSILGAEAGNLALKVWSTGGVYLGGGIPPRIVPHLQKERFMPSFAKKGRFTDVLARIPVYVILNPKTALMGAAYYGFERYQQAV
jgi:glucokinase